MPGIWKGKNKNWRSGEARGSGHVAVEPYMLSSFDPLEQQYKGRLTVKYTICHKYLRSLHIWESNPYTNKERVTTARL